MIIKITVRNKIAMLAAPAAIVCGNSDYSIQFDFDAEWQPFETKTARFIIGGKYTDVVFSGDTVDMPIVYNTRMVAVGVFAGDLRTTTPALIFAHRGILDGTGSPAAPDADVYNAIMQALNDRIPEPSQDGAAGQVLATDGSGGRYWTEQAGGGGSVTVLNLVKRKSDISLPIMKQHYFTHEDGIEVTAQEVYDAYMSGKVVVRIPKGTVAELSNDPTACNSILRIYWWDNAGSQNNPNDVGFVLTNLFGMDTPVGIGNEELISDE